MQSYLAGITFLVVLAVVFGAYWLIVGLPEENEQEALRRRLKADDPQRVRGRVRLLKDAETLSRIATFDRTLQAAGAITHPLFRFLASSGLPLTVGAFLLMCATCFMAAAFIISLYTQIWWLVWPIAFLATFLPYVVISFIRERRVRNFEAQFPEAVELIARALRAGHAFATGIKLAAEELPEPAGPEFKLLYDLQNFGAQMPDALRSFAERVPTLDARFFVTAVLTQREAGGNLSEILDRLAAVMRERFKIRQEVRTRSAHGRITAYVLAFMPPVLAAMLLFLNPSQMQVLASDPLGIRFIIAGVVLQVLGIIIVRKIVDIQY